MKEMICTALGVIGGAVASAFGGWSAGLTTLVVFMAADYATGLLAAGVFHVSRKTAHGGLESRAGWKGLARKCVTLLLVLSACRLELLLDITFVRDAAVIGFCANELLSVTENAALMGVPLPRALKDALELLRKKGDRLPLKGKVPSDSEADEVAPATTADAGRAQRPAPATDAESSGQPCRGGAQPAPAADDEGENKSFAEFASADAKMSNRFLPRRVRGKKHSAGRQCASAASARSGLQAFFVRNPQISDEISKEEHHD